VLFSVIVPTYNRLSLLKRTLESLFEQELKDFEIIVVNDGGSDGTEAYMRPLADGARVRYYAHANSGLAATRRLGLQYAKGEFIAFTDDDCVVPNDWLKKLAALFQQTGIAGAGGATRTGNPANPYAEVNDMMNNYFKSLLSAADVPFLTGNNIAYRRSALEKAGGPDPRFRMGAEDRDLLFRVVRSGGTVLFDPSIVVDHYNDADFRRYVKHQFEFGKGSYLYYTVNRSTRQIPPGVYLGLLLHPFRTHAFGRALRLTLLVVLAQVAVIAGFITAALAGNGEDLR